MRLGERRLIVSELRFRLVERRLVGPRIDEEQFLAFFDVLAGLELDFHDLPADLRLDGDNVDRLHRADGVDEVRHVLANGAGGRHRDRRLPAPRLPSSRRGLDADLTGTDRDDADDDEAEENDEAPHAIEAAVFHRRPASGECCRTWPRRIGERTHMARLGTSSSQVRAMNVDSAAGAAQRSVRKRSRFVAVPQEAPYIGVSRGVE